MDIDKLIQSCASIKIEVTAEDLKNFGKLIATKSFEAIQSQASQKSDSQYITGEKVCEILDISRVTLWQWDKKGITKPIRMGNLKRYRRSDIDAIGQE
ncbi:MAG: helix-turn-helix transcriptional regulator [Candidatus Heimdallarchaeota archaeon]